MNETKLDEYRSILETFVSDYGTYVASYTSGFGYGQDKLRTKMQRQLRLVSNIVAFVHGGCLLEIKELGTINFYQALSHILADTISDERSRKFIESHVESTLNEAIGNIVNGTMPSRQVEPIIPIKDEILKKRCSDLLSAPGSFDRVINQATQVLEERIRNSVSYEKLCGLIPLAKDQIGEPLANKLLSPNNPVIVVSEKLPERIAFHKMVIGVIAYLRNPSHHSLNDKTEWSLAWSVVGIVDSLLSELDNSYISEGEPKT